MNQMGGMMPQMMGMGGMGMDPSAQNMGMGGNPQDMSSMGMNLFNGMYPGMMPPMQGQGGQQIPNQMNMGEKNNNDNDIDNDDEQ